MAAHPSKGQGRPTTKPSGWRFHKSGTMIGACIETSVVFFLSNALDYSCGQAYQFSMQSESTIPLFPLGLVLMPQIPLPLHIFEERYKLMIGECLAEDREFGIVYFNATDIQAVGCTARILKVIKRYDDGRLDILTRGQKRFLIKEICDDKAYLTASVTYFDDEKQADDSGWQDLADRGMALLKQFTSTLESEEGDDFTKKMDFKSISFLLAGCEGFSHEEKQRFLEMTSTGERLKKSVESLEDMIERMKITAKIHTIIGGNGNMKRLAGSK
jgi:Lon protease-like protein